MFKCGVIFALTGAKIKCGGKAYKALLGKLSWTPKYQSSSLTGEQRRFFLAGSGNLGYVGDLKTEKFTQSLSITGEIDSSRISFLASRDFKIPI